jgi:uncharacterized protein (TIGR00725 family)
MIVGVFGTWRSQPDDPICVRAVLYGKALAEAGHAVLTGGYSGVMEAANRGAAEAGGRSIGITCPEIDRLLPPNRWISERIPEPDLLARLATCFRMIDAAVFFPGRSGTITELSLAIEMREKGLLSRPVYLACDYWDGFLRAHQAANEALPYPSSPSPALVSVRCDEPERLISGLEVDA